MQHWLSHWMGLDNLTGPIYGFWSGVGGCFVGTALIGTFLGHLRACNCHVHRCWRFGHHPVEVDGVSYKVCRRHHPAAPNRVTADRVAGGGADA